MTDKQITNLQVMTKAEIVNQITAKPGIVIIAVKAIVETHSWKL
jgi:hypothetical protein